MFYDKQKIFWLLYGLILIIVTILCAEASLRVAAQLSWKIDGFIHPARDCFIHDAQGFFCAANHFAQITTHAAIATTPR
jgi:hypothetical protein